MIDPKEVMDHLLYLYDFNLRTITKDREPYNCGYADSIGQIILDLGRKFGETGVKPCKFEAFKRVCEFSTVEAYKSKYPTAILGVQ
jgi:hypothetical protein